MYKVFGILKFSLSWRICRHLAAQIGCYKRTDVLHFYRCYGIIWHWGFYRVRTVWREVKYQAKACIVKITVSPFQTLQVVSVRDSCSKTHSFELKRTKCLCVFLPSRKCITPSLFWEKVCVLSLRQMAFFLLHNAKSAVKILTLYLASRDVSFSFSVKLLGS